ncbi:hypothetical protein, partial [Planctomicrobium piriforme]|uniref:hypothetical protein n=1 Tax=Planctomicrobium piriforme TaxID=1576369 RepID=UPI001C3120C4
EVQVVYKHFATQVTLDSEVVQIEPAVSRTVVASNFEFAIKHVPALFAAVQKNLATAGTIPGLRCFKTIRETERTGSVRLRSDFQNAVIRACRVGSGLRGACVRKMFERSCTLDQVGMAACFHQS